jgi:hypothetical protein
VAPGFAVDDVGDSGWSNPILFGYLLLEVSNGGEVAEANDIGFGEDRSSVAGTDGTRANPWTARSGAGLAVEIALDGAGEGITFVAAKPPMGAVFALLGNNNAGFARALRATHHRSERFVMPRRR